MANSAYTTLAQRILHELELELETRVGAMEHNRALREVVEDALALDGDKTEVCYCPCKACQLGDHN